jgi:hypothetical protein
MKQRGEPGVGFSVLDGAAVVTGAAVASVHLRGVIRDDLAAPGWVLIWGTFAWVALTAAGPFVFLARRLLRRPPGYPGVGDVLWAVLGLPWLLAAIARPSPAPPGSPPRRDAVFAAGLGVALACVSLLSLVVIWRRWVMVSPDEAARTASGPWTNRLGLALAVAWPIQCGLGLVLVD